MTRSRFGGVLAGTMIVLAACQATITPSPTAAPPTAPPPTTYIGDPVPFSYDPDAGRPGGTITIGDWQEARQFNPYYASRVTEANVASAVWASLLVPSNDYKMLPDLAVDGPSTDNGGVRVPGANGDAMTVTWQLKPNLLWSDGAPLTCDDFRYAWEWVLDPANAGIGLGDAYRAISGVDCPAATELVWHFPRIFEGYLTLAALPPLPRHYLARIPMADQVRGEGFQPRQLPDLPVSGAFAFAKVDPGKELHLVRNPNYRSLAKRKAANLDALVWRWFADSDAMVAAFVAGEIDVATDLQDADIPGLEQRGLHDDISAAPALQYEELELNWSASECSRNPALSDRGRGCPISDPAMRQAIAYAIDKNEINAELLGGTVQVANTNIAPQAWYFADQFPVTFDPARARSALDTAGWSVGSDGIRSRNGLRARIELCATKGQPQVAILARIAGRLHDVGIEAVRTVVSPADMFATGAAALDTPCTLSSGNFDVAERAISSSLDPLDNYFRYHSSQFAPAGLNDARVSDPDLDAALETVKSSVDFTVIKAAMATFQEIYVQKTVEIPLYYRKNVDLVSPRLGNYFSNPTSAGPTWNAVDWYVKP